jgi:replicative DNA helicase
MNDIEIKELFCNPNDERALLSYCFQNANFYYDLANKLEANAFLDPDHSTLFTIFGVLEQQGTSSFDLAMVVNVAQQAFGSLQSIGGIDYLKSINNMKVANSNFDIYLASVLEAYTKYKLYVIVNDNLKDIEKNAKAGLDSEDLIGSIENKILDLSTESMSIDEPKNAIEGLRELIEERMENPVKQMGISTGYKILDSQIDGLVPATLNVVSARPKMGKSSLLSNIAYYVAYIGGPKYPVLYVDTEMGFGQWRDRILSSMSGVPERVVKHGGYTSEDYEKLKRAASIMEKGKLFHEYMPGYTVDKLSALYKKYKLKHDIGLMVFDYIKEPDSRSVDARRKEYQILGDVTTKLKDLTGSLNIPCLTAVQLNRDEKVADSDRIVRYADTIMEWKYKTKEEVEAKGIQGGQFKLVVRETRRGGMTPEEGIGYLFRKSWLNIAEAEPQEQIIDYSNKIVNYGDSDDTII